MPPRLPTSDSEEIQQFLEERAEILKLRQALMEKTGHPVSIQETVSEWLLEHRSNWRAQLEANSPAKSGDEDAELYREFVAQRAEFQEIERRHSWEYGDLNGGEAVVKFLFKHRQKWKKGVRRPEQEDASLSERKSLLVLPLREINDALYSHLSREPELIRRLSPREFEELIADILKDRGYEVELTPQTRDGGRDILAALSTPIGKILTIVECKRYQPHRKVGIDIVERFLHVIDRKDNASCGLIATTSFFSVGAKTVARDFQYRLKLRDFDGVREWIAQYGKWRKDSCGDVWRPSHEDDPATRPSSSIHQRPRL